MAEKKNLYPFTALVGQEQMKKALLLNVINPALGGVLIKGEKGTAKSTAVRGLASLLPEKEAVLCPFGCDPHDRSKMCADCLAKTELQTEKRKMKVVDLPVSATEDRVVGTIDLEQAIQKGEKKFEPGILAQANRNILYVDEVNLLDDHVVDVLLDAAAMGVNTVEREGVSYSHPSCFILVGTMNPEEGDLRPQLLDRFGLVVQVSGEKDVEKRMEVVRRRLDFEEDSQAFLTQYEQSEQELREKIAQARVLLPEVVYEEEILRLAVRIAIETGVDGHRADITMLKTAMTIAALAGRREVIRDDLLDAAALVLPHRMRRKPFEEGVLEMEKIKEMLQAG